MGTRFMSKTLILGCLPQLQCVEKPDMCLVGSQDMCLVESQDMCLVESQDMCLVESRGMCHLGIWRPVRGDLGLQAILKEKANKIIEFYGV